MRCQDGAKYAASGKGRLIPYEDYAEGGEFIDTVPIIESDCAYRKSI